MFRGRRSAFANPGRTGLDPSTHPSANVACRGRARARRFAGNGDTVSSVRSIRRARMPARSRPAHRRSQPPRPHPPSRAPARAAAPRGPLSDRGARLVGRPRLCRQSRTRPQFLLTSHLSLRPPTRPAPREPAILLIGLRPRPHESPTGRGASLSADLATAPQPHTPVASGPRANPSLRPSIRNPRWPGRRGVACSLARRTRPSAPPASALQPHKPANYGRRDNLSLGTSTRVSQSPGGRRRGLARSLSQNPPPAPPAPGPPAAAEPTRPPVSSAIHPMALAQAAVPLVRPPPVSSATQPLRRALACPAIDRAPGRHSTPARPGAREGVHPRRRPTPGDSPPQRPRSSQLIAI
jgi:hypothetical protein